MADGRGHRIHVAQSGHRRRNLAAPREGGDGRGSQGLKIGTGNALAGFFLVIAGGVLACPVVELAFGRGGKGQRLAIGIGLAVLDIVVFLVFLQVFMAIAIKSGPSHSSSGPGIAIVVALVPWIIPVARAIMLRR